MDEQQKKQQQQLPELSDRREEKFLNARKAAIGKYKVI